MREMNDNTYDRHQFAATVPVMKYLKVVGDFGGRTNPDSSSKTPPIYILNGLIYSLSWNFNLALDVKSSLTRSKRTWRSAAA